MANGDACAILVTKGGVFLSLTMNIREDKLDYTFVEYFKGDFYFLNFQKIDFFYVKMFLSIIEILP